MIECKKCLSIDVKCTDAGSKVVYGEEAFVEVVECNECGAKGRIVDTGTVRYEGSIRRL